MARTRICLQVREHEKQERSEERDCEWGCEWQTARKRAGALRHCVLLGSPLVWSALVLKTLEIDTSATELEYSLETRRWFEMTRQMILTTPQKLADVTIELEYSIVLYIVN